jgi:hypothetical protein
VRVETERVEGRQGEDRAGDDAARGAADAGEDDILEERRASRVGARERPMARIEIGIDASITWPTLSPEYAEATVKITQSSTPQPTERPVTSSGAAVARTTGWYASPAASGV